MKQTVSSSFFLKEKVPACRQAGREHGFLHTLIHSRYIFLMSYIKKSLELTHV